MGLFDRRGTLCGLGRVLVAQQIGNADSCELAIDHFWAILQKALSQACRQAGASAADIKGLAYSSQANSFVLLDDHEQPLTPLVLWPDKRVPQGDPILEEFWQRDEFLEKTGLGLEISPQFCLAKLRWLQQYRPDIWSQTARIMTISDYLTFHSSF